MPMKSVVNAVTNIIEDVKAFERPPATAGQGRRRQRYPAITARTCRGDAQQPRRRDEDPRVELRHVARQPARRRGEPRLRDNHRDRAHGVHPQGHEDGAGAVLVRLARGPLGKRDWRLRAFAEGGGRRTARVCTSARQAWRRRRVAEALYGVAWVAAESDARVHG